MPGWEHQAASEMQSQEAFVLLHATMIRMVLGFTVMNRLT
jgi:hypothetical protein